MNAEGLDENFSVTLYKSTLYGIYKYARRIEKITPVGDHHLALEYNTMLAVIIVILHKQFYKDGITLEEARKYAYHCEMIPKSPNYHLL